MHYGELYLIGTGRSGETNSANVISDLPRVD
jgi:hypothetical protein